MEKKQAAVIGCPIGHSLSPKLHNYWLKKYHIDGLYKSYEVKPEDLESFICHFKENNLIGINITVPHKEEAYKIVKKHGIVTDIADQTKAVNTVFYQDDKLFGTNTDYYGFKNSFLNQAVATNLANKKILIIGAGGAARAIIAGLLNENNVHITVVNRSVEKARELQMFFNNKILASDLSNLERKISEHDIIVNSTSCGLNGKNNLLIDFNKIKTKKIFYDIVYVPLKTKFLLEAEKRNHDIITGIGMLIYQAVPAFNYFFNRLPEVDDNIAGYLI